MTRESWGGVEVEETEWHENPVWFTLPGDDWDTVIVDEDEAEKHMIWDAHYEEFWDKRLAKNDRSSGVFERYKR